MAEPLLVVSLGCGRESGWRDLRLDPPGSTTAESTYNPPRKRARWEVPGALLQRGKRAESRL